MDRDDYIIHIYTYIAIVNRLDVFFRIRFVGTCDVRGSKSSSYRHKSRGEERRGLIEELSRGEAELISLELVEGNNRA